MQQPAGSPPEDAAASAAASCPDHVDLDRLLQPQSQQGSRLPDALIAAVALAVLLLSSWLTNRRFGHATYHRGAPIEDEQDGEATTKPPSRDVAATAAALNNAGPPLLQEVLPQELLVDQILPFLTPHDVINGFALCSRSCWQAAEAPGLWARFAARAGLLRLGGRQSRAEEQQEDEGAPLPPIKSKLEFFRRAFLLPYALTKGHGSVSSCRVVVHGAAYDVTGYLGTHPGGEAILLEYGGGLDATTVFELALHSEAARRKMREFLLWDPAASSCLGKRGTILGLFLAAATGGRGLGAIMGTGSSGGSTSDTTDGAAASSSIGGERTPSHPSIQTLSGVSGGILRANDTRSPPTIVHTLEAVNFGP